jgi:putative membrane protein
MKLKIIIVILLLLLLVIFALQNTEIVGIKLWFWEVKIPRALLISLSIIVGVIIGMILSKCNLKMLKRDVKKENEHES